MVQFLTQAGLQIDFKLKTDGGVGGSITYKPVDENNKPVTVSIQRGTCEYNFNVVDYYQTSDQHRCLVVRLSNRTADKSRKSAICTIGTSVKQTT